MGQPPPRCQDVLELPRPEEAASSAPALGLPAVPTQPSGYNGRWLLQSSRAGAAKEGSELPRCHLAALHLGVLSRGDIWLIPQVKNLVFKCNFCPGSFLLSRLRRYPRGRGAGSLSQAEGVQSQALPCPRAAKEGRTVGSTAAAPSLTRGAESPAEGAPLASLKHSETEPFPLPLSHMVLRLPAEMQLKQSIF